MRSNCSHRNLKLIQDAPSEVIPLVRRTQELRETLRFLIESEESLVRVLDRAERGRGCFLQATPIDVSSVLAARLFERFDA